MSAGQDLEELRSEYLPETIVLETGLFRLRWE